MKKLAFLIFVLGVALVFSCHKKSPTETPPDNNTHPQVDIPWPSLADSPWPMHHHDPQSTGRSRFSGPQQGKVVWKLNVGGPVSTSVAIGPDSTIYFATSYDTSEGFQRAYLYALDWSGNLKWKFKLNDNIQDCSPLIGVDGSIYIGTTDHYLLAIHPNGTVKWRFEADAGIRQLGLNIGIDGMLYFVDLNHHLYAVDQNGILNWKNNGNYYFANGEQSGIAISPDGETLYLGCLGTAESDTIRGLIAVAKNGQVKWLFKTGSILGTTAIDNSGNIFFVAGLGSDEQNETGIFSVNSEGQLRWSYSAASVDSWDPTIDYDGNIYISLWESATQLSLFSFNNVGNMRWKSDISDNGSIWSSFLCDAEGMIYYTTFAGVNAVFSDGEEKWKVQIGQNRLICPALALHYLFVGTWFHGPGREFYCIN
jgi:outer membrane protein assembly factor BamB